MKKKLSFFANWSARRLHAMPAPNQQQRTSNKPPPELRLRNFANKRRLSMQIGAKTCERNMRATWTYSDRASIFACHRWWLGAYLHTTTTTGCLILALFYCQFFFSLPAWDFPRNHAKMKIALHLWRFLLTRPPCNSSPTRVATGTPTTATT